ncbi:MAG: acyltransferase family protein [Chloroflexota bacterium]
MSANSDRIAWVDVFKFFGIWAIYIGHFGGNGGKVYPFVFTYHVPMFFFAAGFFAPRYLKDTPLAFIKKKTLQLMIPYVFFSLLALIVFTLQSNWEFGEIVNALKGALLGIRDQIFAGSLWFIPCLYIMLIGDYFIRKLVNHPLWVLAVAFGLFIVTQTLLPNNPAHNPSWFMNLDSAMFYYVYYALGAVLFPLLTMDLTKSIHKIMAGLLALASAGVTVITFIIGPYWFLGKISTVLPVISTFKLTTPVFDVVIALIIIYFNIWIAKLCAHIPVLGELGRETLAFCGTEDVIKILLTQTLAMVNLKARLVTPLITVIFSLVCLLVSKYTLVNFLNAYFPWAVGKYNLTPIAEIDAGTNKNTFMQSGNG